MVSNQFATEAFKCMTSVGKSNTFIDLLFLCSVILVLAGVF